MKNIFENGSFNKYAFTNINAARSAIIKHSQYGQKKVTVFISHKHEDLEDLKGVLGFLKREYNVEVYIDSQDPAMPKVTSAETAYNIKKRIDQCDKFILLATNNAIESKWCNWELGYGDARKFKKNIALFPIKPKGALDSKYKGSEYMDIYPFISYSNGYSDTYKTGERVAPGYYVQYYDKNEIQLVSLSDWLKEW